MPRDIQLRQNGDIQLRVLHQPANPIDLCLDNMIWLFNLCAEWFASKH